MELSRRHLKAIAKPGGLFEDKAVTRLPWRGNNRRVRLVVYRWFESDADETGLTPVQSLQQACERIGASLQACGVQSARVDGRGLYAWLLPWFNPAPRLTDEAPEEFYRRVAYPESSEDESLELPFDHDFAERLFFSMSRIRMYLADSGFFRRSAPPGDGGGQTTAGTVDWSTHRGSPQG
nr:hypothetical protein GCM10020185_00990 [Pseudomonas brassicacearum subsp. brassicacearum]